MKNKSNRVLISVMLCITLYSCSSTKEWVITDRPLQWSDYTGKVDKNSDFGSKTMYSVKYTYDVDFDGNTAIITNLSVLPIFQSNSWVTSGNKTDYKLLIHEQGHYNIDIICALEFKRRVLSMTFYRGNYSERMQAVFENVWSHYMNMQNQYDEETNHYYNEEEQIRWNGKIRKMLENHED